jgi:hypothetical protein
MLTSDDRRAGMSALGAAARAFTAAQNKGYVWLGDEGLFETCEEWDLPPAPKVLHPDQLRLA